MFREITLGERISSLRLGLGLTQKELAQHFNISDKAISKWENSENEPSITDIQKLAEFFEISLDLLLKGQAVNQRDNQVLEKIRLIKEQNKLKQEIKEFLKKECPYKDISMEDLFVIEDKKSYAVLDAVLLFDDFNFFNKINEKFAFIKNEKGKNIYLPQPYHLTLDDLKENNTIEFFDMVINDLEEQYQEREKSIATLTKVGYGYGQRNTINIKEKLSTYLENLNIDDVDDDRVYEKIVYLIDKGATYYQRIPYESDSGGYRIKEDVARTTFTYKVCVDHIYFINKLNELEEEIEKMKNKK